MVPPLTLDISEGGQRDIDAAVRFLSQSNGYGYAERFTERLGQVIVALCEQVAREIADGDMPFGATDERASLRFTRPVYREPVQVAKTWARRSSAGLWYAFYALEDREGTGAADTLVLVGVRHSAAAPYSFERQDDGEAEQD